MPSPTLARDLERLLLEGLEASGYRVEQRTGADPWDLVVVRADTAPLRLHVLLRRLLPAASRRRRDLQRLALSQREIPRIGGGADAVTLLLGADLEREVLVGWRGAAGGGASLGGQAWVPVEALERASAGELVTVPRRRGRHVPAPSLAFPPERIGEYIAAVRDPETGHEAPSPSRTVIRRVSRAPVFEGLDRRLFEVDFARGIRRPLRANPPIRLSARKAPRRLVETGFAPADDPERNLSAADPLEPGAVYSFWFAVGGARGTSIETDPAAAVLPSLERATLVVRVLAFEDEVELTGETRGTIAIEPEHDPCVGERAATVSGDDALHERTLFFPVRMPQREGRFHLRCNVHLGSTVIQSRLVSCQVGGTLTPGAPALTSDLDYALTDTFALSRLAELPEHDLSLTINGVGPSHQLRFFSASGDEELCAGATLEAEQLTAMVERARGALAQASWGSEEEWDRRPESYRYRPGGIPSFEADLFRLARRGRRLYYGITQALDGGSATLDRLEAVGRGTLRVQIATTRPGLYVPAALFYDHKLVTTPGTAVSGRYALCDAFAALLRDRGPLAQLDCFANGCAQRDDELRVCPSGFWGFRHELGWPPQAAETPAETPSDDPPRIVIGVSTDGQLRLRDAHVAELLELVGAQRETTVASSSAELVTLLQAGEPSLLYFYCHGGTADGEAYLELGRPSVDIGIDGPFLQDNGIRWGERRPLVFVNGCHTTALEPRQLADLVTAFVSGSNALGVVGTELTVFEPLARRFADAALGGWLDGSQTIGEAVRHARLQLLGERNPLGLIYVPFVAAGTRLQR